MLIMSRLLKKGREKAKQKRVIKLEKVNTAASKDSGTIAFVALFFASLPVDDLLFDAQLRTSMNGQRSGSCLAAGSP